MRVILLLLLFAISWVASGKEQLDNYTIRTISVARQSATGDSIRGLNFRFSLAINEISIDSGRLVVLLRERKDERWGRRTLLLCANLATGTTIYSNATIPPGVVRFTKDLVLITTEEGCKVYQRSSGKYLHTVRYRLRYIRYDENKALSEGGTYIDLFTNKGLWTAGDLHKSSWSEIAAPDKNSLLIGGEGLCFVRWDDGLGWRYQMPTHLHDNSMVIAGAIIGGLTGAMVLGATTEQIWEISSNMLTDTATKVVYYSGRKEIVSLGWDGKLLWSRPIKKSEASRANFWLSSQGDLVQLNRGFAYVNGKQDWYGVPFIARYNKLTGDMLRRDEMEYSSAETRRSFVSSWDRIQDTILLKFGRQLLLYRPSDAEGFRALKKETISVSTDSLEVLSKINYYVRNNDQTFSRMDELMPSSFLVGNTHEVFEVGSQLAVMRKWLHLELWRPELSVDGYTVLTSGNERVILKGSRELAELPTSGKLYVQEGNLLHILGNELTVIPLAAFDR